MQSNKCHKTFCTAGIYDYRYRMLLSLMSLLLPLTGSGGDVISVVFNDREQMVNFGNAD